MANNWINQNICIPFNEIRKDRPEGHWYAVLGNMDLATTVLCFENIIL